MEFLIDPNIAYVLIVAAVMLALVTVIVPGTGLPEAGMILCLGAAWYELSRLQPNAWALVVVAFSVAPFVLAIRQAHFRRVLLVLAVVMLTIGSVFLFTDKNGRPEVNFMLAGSLSTFCALFIWIAIERGLTVQGNRPVNDPDALVGVLGEARTEIHYSGSVQVEGELWSARSEKPIPQGSQVRVLRRDGFVLTVQKSERLTK